MPKNYALRRGEPLGHGLRRIAAALASRAASSLTDKALPPPRRIHDARRHFKELRSLLRLFRIPLGDVRAHASRTIRDAARQLDTYRDATAAAEQVDDLPRGLRRDLGSTASERLQAIVREHHARLYGDAAELSAHVDRALLAMTTVRTLIERARIIDGATFALIEAGFVRTIAEGQKTMRTAQATHDDADVHEWRKRVKDHWHHVRLLVEVRPALLRPRESDLHDLSRILGEHHDLWIIAQIVRRNAPRLGGTSEAKRIDAIFAARRKKLAERAWPVGRGVYASAPREVACDVAALWSTWYAA